MRLGYVIFYVPNVEATVTFYEKAFGLTRRFVVDSGEYGEMETGGTALAFAQEAFVASKGHPFRPTRPDETPAAAEIGLVTDDVAGAYERALAAGAAAHSPPRREPHGQTVAYVRDCNGALVEICTPMGG